jgi:acetoin utilization deacetylase AcuC-like enzyme
MTDIAIAFDERFREHDPGPGHPERPERLDAVRSALEHSGLLSTSLRVRAEAAEQDLLTRIHTEEYIERVRRACESGQSYVDEPDCNVCPASFDLARLAAGLVVQAVRHVAAGDVRRAFCAIRPPGHHAEYNRGMGFCLFNNIAVAAAALRAECGLERILILDWDVHHGNGTQHSFEADPSVMFISLHEHPAYQYPGTGYEHETGVGPGAGATLNIPLLPGAGDRETREAFERALLPAADRVEPQIILISAGFDGHRDDPLGHLDLTDETYVWMLRQILELAERHAGGRVATVLEGGYDLGVLRRCVQDHLDLLRE